MANVDAAIALAQLAKLDDILAGVKSTALKFGEASVYWLAFFFALALALIDAESDDKTDLGDEGDAEEEGKTPHAGIAAAPAALLLQADQKWTQAELEGLRAAAGGTPP